MKLLRSQVFIFFVAIPNTLAILYFLFIASPIYVSTSSFIVTKSGNQTTSLVSMLSGASNSGSLEGGYILRKYLLSWSAFSKLARPLDLATRYAAGDFVSRYGGLATWFRANDVSLWRYYQDHVGVSVSQKSGIVTLHTEGYSPRFALSISTAILRQAIAHLNRMNADREKYYVASAEEQEQEASDLLDADNQKLAAYRSTTGVYDPEKLYLSRLSLLNGLTMESVKLQSELLALTQATPHSPSIENIKTELASVNDRIAEANTEIRHLSVKSAEYENLVTNKNNQMIVLKKADVALQEARIKAMKNQYYFTVISQPSMPASPELPDRSEWVGGIFLASIILWGLLR